MLKARLKTIVVISSLFLTLILSGCSLAKPGPHSFSSEIIGVKIYQHTGDRQALFASWKKLKINTAFIGLELASQDHFIQEAREAGFKTFIILPIFFNPEKLKNSPELYAITGEGQPAKDDWVEFVCPGNRLYRQEIVNRARKLVADLKPDGLSLDFIRHFIFWEKVYPDSTLDLIRTTCFCPDCLRSFQQETGITIPEGISGYPAGPAWILANHRQAWQEWRNRQITSMVEEISRAVRQVNHFLLLNIHLVPWRTDDFERARIAVAGQDISQLFRQVDYLSPMCYAHMLKRPPDWINSVVINIQQSAPNPVIPSIQVKEAYLPEKLSLQEFDRSLQSALQPPSRGVVFWNWEALSESAEKQEIVRRRVREFLQHRRMEEEKNRKQLTVARAGLRSSPYGARKPFPSVDYWLGAAVDMARHFKGSTPTLVWIVSTMERDLSRKEAQVYTSRTRLTFPAPLGRNPEQFANIVFAEEDANEAYLQAFDRAGFRVWLQVEPAMADIPTLIDLIMGRYGHHPCVIGFGVDVEWHRWSEQDNEGVAVSDDHARLWVEHLRRWNPSYLLFLKHWEMTKLPPAYRQGLAFIDDSQIFQSLEEIVLEFARWARWFYPSPVGFQYGYPSDRPWWRQLPDPPGEIGRAILRVAPNTTDLFWVDFTMKEIWPDKK
ncbi:MAG: hypothetical protein ACUVRL_06780 [Candidatus Saccharicenans sp.]|uniref:hypothetical protein n=1 Tax=Candidatus Saccharicenans sp. TaxID=2819258 RepID=UPI0040496523